MLLSSRNRVEPSSNKRTRNCLFRSWVLPLMDNSSHSNVCRGRPSKSHWLQRTQQPTGCSTLCEQNKQYKKLPSGSFCPTTTTNSDRSPCSRKVTSAQTIGRNRSFGSGAAFRPVCCNRVENADDILFGVSGYWSVSPFKCSAGTIVPGTSMGQRRASSSANSSLLR